MTELGEVELRKLKYLALAIGFDSTNKSTRQILYQAEKVSGAFESVARQCRKKAFLSSRITIHELAFIAAYELVSCGVVPKSAGKFSWQIARKALDDIKSFSMIRD